MAVMFITIFVFVGAMSFVDARQNPSQYTVIWAIAITLLLIVIFIAFLDVLNNFRIHRAHTAAMSAANRQRVIEELTKAAAETTSDSSES